MTDLELLKLAAKAANVDVRLIKRRNTAVCEGDDYYEDLPEDRWYFVLKDFSQKWNPLADDGDALRLAVKLAESAPGTHFTLSISKIHDGRGFADAQRQHAGAGFFSHINPTEQVVGPDLAAATRRAIVHAAAEIGRNMK